MPPTMARAPRSRARFEVFTGGREDHHHHHPHHHAEGSVASPGHDRNSQHPQQQQRQPQQGCCFSPLREISASNNACNIQPPRSSSHFSPATDPSSPQSKRLRIRDANELPSLPLKSSSSSPKTAEHKYQGQIWARQSRPLISSNSFALLETVPESEQDKRSFSATSRVSDRSNQHFDYVQVSGDRTHPISLALAAQKISSAEDQLAKHQRGEFEWVLIIKEPSSKTQNENDPPQASLFGLQPDIETAFFGCNFLPRKDKSGSEDRKKNSPSLGGHTLLVTPLKPTIDLLRAYSGSTSPRKTMSSPSLDDALAAKLPSSPPSQMSSETRSSPKSHSPKSCTSVRDESVAGSVADTAASRSPLQPVSRIEDSVAALDELEDQLEAFDVAAQIKQVMASDIKAEAIAAATASPLRRSVSARVSNISAQSPTASQRGSVRASSGSLRVKSTENSSLRKSVSVNFDETTRKEGGKSLGRAHGNSTTNPLPPKQTVKSKKPSTVPSSFELPGESVSRRIKEQREARLAAKAEAEKSVASPSQATLGVHHTRSAKAPTRSTFELPGEAISRRKREERDNRLRNQEEEDRRRREFKAKPIRSANPPCTLPRETIASRARQSKQVHPQEQHPTVQKCASIVYPGHTTATTLKPHPEPKPLAPSASTGSSIASSSTKRSSLSFEDVNMQRARGKEIYQRDSVYAQEREKERREREAMARLAREKAAERSRAKSREWAEKQRRKRESVLVGETVVA